jgi:2-iminobutanoate/2-iminopropanoate deaminase
MSEKREVKHPDKKFTYGLFSAGIACDGWLYISGAGPLDMTTGKLIVGTIEEETAITLGHIDKVLKEAGCTRDSVVKCTCYLSNLDHFEGFNRAYGEFFTGVRPARSTVGANLLKNIKVEIDAVAKLPS